MTEDDKVAFKEFLQGASIVVGFSVGVILILLSIVYFTSGGEPTSSSFEVVDKYKECDVVRYVPHQAAEYKYLLYCEGNK